MIKQITLEKILLLVAVIGLLCLNKCRTTELHDSQVLISSLHQKLDSTTNKNNQLVYEQKVLETSSQQALKVLSDSIFHLRDKDKRNRDIIALYRANSNVVFHTLQDVGWIDEEATEKYKTFLLDSINKAISSQCSEALASYMRKSILIPALFKDSNSLYTISATVKENSKLAVTDLSIFNDFSLQFVEHKHFLKKRTIEVQVMNTSPFVKTTHANSFFYTPKKKPHLLTKALILGAGIFLGTKL